MTESFVKSRIDIEVKNEAVRILNGMGLTISDAIRLFFHQIVTEKSLPFDLEPDAVTVAAMEAARSGEDLEAVSLDQLVSEWNDACAT